MTYAKQMGYGLRAWGTVNGNIADSVHIVFTIGMLTFIAKKPIIMN